MTHLQAKRIADLTQGYNPTTYFEIVGGDGNSLYITVYNLICRIDPDGHGIIHSKNDPKLVLDRF